MGKFLLGYLRERMHFFLAAAVWMLVFLVLFRLEDISVHVLWYPFLLCSVFFCLYMAWDCWKYHEKHQALLHVMGHVDVTLEHLPEPTGQLERDYQELLAELLARKDGELTKRKTAQGAAMEYLTLWSHQLKTPLAALQLTASELDGAYRKELLNRIFEVEQYADMMLQYLRLEGAGTDYLLKEYSLSEMVRQSVKYFARIFISKGIAVQIDIAEDVRVVTDEKWLVFLLKQLISNALKYTDNGSIHIFFEEECLVVEDTGIGIAAEDLPRIFERGYTGYNGRKDKKATGIGLYLSALIADALRHSIHITSEVGVGTRVRLDFCRSQMENAE